MSNVSIICKTRMMDSKLICWQWPSSDNDEGGRATLVLDKTCKILIDCSKWSAIHSGSNSQPAFRPSLNHRSSILVGKKKMQTICREWREQRKEWWKRWEIMQQRRRIKAWLNTWMDLLVILSVKEHKNAAGKWDLTSDIEGNYENSWDRIDFFYQQTFLIWRQKLSKRSYENSVKM